MQTAYAVPTDLVLHFSPSCFLWFPAVEDAESDQNSFISTAVPFPRGKLVNAALMSLHLHSVMACSLPRHLGSVGRLALHQCNMNRSGDLLLFHIRVIREAGRLTLVFGKGTELERGVGGRLPYYPVTPEILWQNSTHPLWAAQPKTETSWYPQDCSPHSSKCRSCSSHREVLFSLFATHGPWNLLRPENWPQPLQLTGQLHRWMVWVRSGCTTVAVLCILPSPPPAPPGNLLH